WNATRLKADFFARSFVPEGTAIRYYAMEFIDGPTLKTLLTVQPLAVEDAAALGRFLLRVSQYLLRFDLVHGDIKPENILVVKENDELSFKLLDFGSASELFSVTSRAGTA